MGGGGEPEIKNKACEGVYTSVYTDGRGTEPVNFAAFDWDRGNREKCEKHGVSIAEIEDIFARTVFVAPDPAHSSEEERFKAIGVTAKGRKLFVVFTWRRPGGELLLRPIRARYMHGKEIAAYEEIVAGQKDLPDPR